MRDMADNSSYSRGLPRLFELITWEMHTSHVMLGGAIQNIAPPNTPHAPHAATKACVPVWIWCCCFPFPPTSAQFNCMHFRWGERTDKGKPVLPQSSIKEVYECFPQTGVKSPNEDTIHNSSSLNVSFLTDVQLNKLPKATWVVVVNSLCIAKSFHNWTVKTESDRSVNMWPACQQLHTGLVKGTALWQASPWHPPQQQPTSQHYPPFSNGHLTFLAEDASIHATGRQIILNYSAAAQ